MICKVRTMFKTYFNLRNHPPFLPTIQQLCLQYFHTHILHNANWNPTFRNKRNGQTTIFVFTAKCQSNSENDTNSTLPWYLKTNSTEIMGNHFYEQSAPALLWRGIWLWVWKTACFSAAICPSRLLSTRHRSWTCNIVASLQSLFVILHGPKFRAI